MWIWKAVQYNSPLVAEKTWADKQGNGGFFLVDGKTASEGDFPAKPIRVKVSDPSNAEYGNADVRISEVESKSKETDEEAMVVLVQFLGIFRGIARDCFVAELKIKR